MIKSMFLVPLVTSMLAVASVNGDDDSNKKDLDKHQGTWTIVSEEYDGKKLPLGESAGLTRVVKGSEVTRTKGQVSGKSILRLDASKQPKQFDAEIVEGPGKGQIIQGIYEFDGDSLKMWRSRDRQGSTQCVSHESWLRPEPPSLEAYKAVSRGRHTEMINESAIRARFEMLAPFLNERTRRLAAAAEAAAIGRGGIARVSRATGVSRRAIASGLDQLKAPDDLGAAASDAPEAVARGPWRPTPRSAPIWSG